MISLCHYCFPAIKPQVAVEIVNTNPTVYKSEDGKTYSVENGNEFSVLCSSSGEFSGRVTWFKIGDKGNSCSFCKSLIQ